MTQNLRVTGRATSVTVRPDGIFCTYHDTIVAQSQGRTITLRSGGHLTYTTKLRMNQFANQFWRGAFVVSQRAGAWVVTVGDKTLPFVDGMSFEV
jgi:hypothetical protein